MHPRYGLRPAPFYLGLVYAIAGLLLSLLLVRDTGQHLALERQLHPRSAAAPLSFGHIFARVSLTDRSLFAASQAGLVNNLNDGMSWGILPLFFVAHGLGIEQIGVLKAVYPAVWGLLQILTGSLSDRIGRRTLIASGMWVQAIGLVVTAVTGTFAWRLLGSVLMGAGTAMVYPTLLAAVPDSSESSWRARGLSVYRFGATSATPLGRSPPACSPICLALPYRSSRSAGSLPFQGESLYLPCADEMGPATAPR